jgi:hypothetical protein
MNLRPLHGAGFRPLAGSVLADGVLATDRAQAGRSPASALDPPVHPHAGTPTAAAEIELLDPETHAVLEAYAGASMPTSPPAIYPPRAEFTLDLTGVDFIPEP